MSDLILPYQNKSLADIPGEIWKDIPGFEGYYQASTAGRIKSLDRIKNKSPSHSLEGTEKVRYY